MTLRKLKSHRICFSNIFDNFLSFRGYLFSSDSCQRLVKIWLGFCFSSVICSNTCKCSQKVITWCQDFVFIHLLVYVSRNSTDLRNSFFFKQHYKQRTVCYQYKSYLVLFLSCCSIPKTKEKGNDKLMDDSFYSVRLCLLNFGSSVFLWNKFLTCFEVLLI